MNSHSNTEKERAFLIKRFQELARRCYNRQAPCNTDFLTLDEQSLFLAEKERILKEVPSVFIEVTGGFPNAERKILYYYPDFMDLELLNQANIFAYLKIQPKYPKFAQSFSHRDVLGSLMSLGVERSKIGDIYLDEKNDVPIAYVILLEEVCDYFLHSLEKIKHTDVFLELINPDEISYQLKFKEITGTVASIRLDSVCALAFKASRSEMTRAISDAKVFVNGRLITSNGYRLNIGDIISIRGMGRFQYTEENSTTRKGRIYIKLMKYV